MEWVDINFQTPSKEEKVIFFRNNEVDCGYFEYHFNKSNVQFWMPLPKQPERLNPENIDSKWIKWDILQPPKDVKGILIKFNNGKIWTDLHYYGSNEYKKKTIGNSIPISWTFMERNNSYDKSVQCNVFDSLNLQETVRGSSEE